MTSTITKKEVAALAKPAEELAQTLIEEVQNGFKIKNQKQATKVGEYLIQVKKLFKDLEAERTSVTKPLLASKRKIDGWFSPTTKLLGQAETELKGVLSAFLKASDNERTEALKAGKKLAEPELPSGVSSSRKTYTKLVDFAAVPEEYLKSEYDRVDWAKVDAATKAGLEVPGVVVEVEHSIAVWA